MKRLSPGTRVAYLSALFQANFFWRTAIIHMGMDVHVRNSVLNAKDATEKVVGTGEGWLTELSTSELKELFALR